MVRKTKRNFTEQTKRQAVQDYVSGKKSAQEVADELAVRPDQIYKWRVAMDEETKGQRVAELEAQGASHELAKLLVQKDEEIAAYQKKVGEQAVIIDLLKKLQTPSSYQRESELSGWIATTKKSDRKRRPAK